MAPIFEDVNLANDHNALAMDIARKVALRHDFVCVFHEKPFAGLNGSGTGLCPPDATGANAGLACETRTAAAVAATVPAIDPMAWRRFMAGDASTRNIRNAVL